MVAIRLPDQIELETETMGEGCRAVAAITLDLDNGRWEELSIKSFCIKGSRMKNRLGLFALCAIGLLGCQLPITDQQTQAKGTFPVVVEISNTNDSRGLFADSAVDSIAIQVTDSSDVVVGSGSLSKGASSWTGTISLTATGSLTFSARGVNSTNGLLYGGVLTQTISGATVLTIPVVAKTQLGGAIQNGSLHLSKVVTSLAGYGFMGADGTGTDSRFYLPDGLTSDGTNLYVSDTANHTIRKIVIATGAVTTLAGSPGLSGNTDGTGNSARFFGPDGITSDGVNLYVADVLSHTIRKVVMATGEVTTLAGTAGTSGSADGIGTAAQFKYPRGITNDGTNLYLSDTQNHTIRKIVIATGEVSTLAGTANSFGSDNGTGSNAKFFYPTGITCVGSNLYVADMINYTIRKVEIATGVVTTLAGLPNNSGPSDGTGSLARFNVPQAITSDGTNLFVADSGNHAIRKIEISTGVVTTLAGLAENLGSTDGTGATARFRWPRGITLVGSDLYVSDQGNNAIRRVVISTAAVTTLAGLAGNSDFADGTGLAARFHGPTGCTTDGVNLFITDTRNHTIRKVVIATGVSTTLAGSPNVSGSVDGIGTEARFREPQGITTDGTNLYVADSSNHAIRKLVIATGVVTTLAGTLGTTGFDDGIGSLARFSFPNGLTTDGANLYVSDTYGQKIRKIVIATGEVTTLAGTSGSSGTDDGTGVLAKFNYPQGLTTDGTYLYVADSENHTIRKVVMATGVVTTFAGTAGTSGTTDGLGTLAKFRYPHGITTDGFNLYVSDKDNHSIRKIVIASGMVSTLTGSPEHPGLLDGTGSSARFNFPNGIVTDGTSLFITDTGNSTIRKIQ